MDPATATLISAGIGLFTSSRMRRDAKRQAAAALKYSLKTRIKVYKIHLKI